MSFLIDAQLPELICEVLQSIGIKAIHINELPNGDETPDVEITEYADKKGLFVLTKDQDFYHSHMIKNQPTKLFLISIGNTKNRFLLDLFRTNAVAIKKSISRSDFIELSNEGLIEHK